MWETSSTDHPGFTLFDNFFGVVATLGSRHGRNHWHPLALSLVVVSPLRLTENHRTTWTWCRILSHCLLFYMFYILSLHYIHVFTTAYLTRGGPRMSMEINPNFRFGARRGGAAGSLRVRLGQGLCGWTQPGQPSGGSCTMSFAMSNRCEKEPGLINFPKMIYLNGGFENI